MSTHEDTSSLVVDELARRRQEREAASGEERPLRELVRDETRRAKRRHAAATRARERTGPPLPPTPGADGAA